MAQQHPQKNHSLDEAEDIMTDADFERAMEALREEGNEEVNELLMAMSDNQIISWDEAERILGATSTEPIKSSLPQQTRPTEPDNDTDVDSCMQRLLKNDPKLVEINMNNMKRTPVPKIKRLIEAIQENEHLEKLSLANMGLYDMDLQPLIDILEHNTTLRSINLETNYLSGDFFSRLLKTALTNQTLEEIKAVNQGVSFSTQAEREIIDAVVENRGLTKVSINLRLPEGRFKVEQATIRNQEIRRILRRQMMQQQQQQQKEQPKEEPKAKGGGPAARKEPAAAKVADEKKLLKRTPSGAAAELAKQMTGTKLAIAGVNTLRPSTSSIEERESPPEKAKTAVRERARDAEQKANKPYEVEKTAERAILSEAAKERRVAAGGRWPPAGAAGATVESAKTKGAAGKKSATAAEDGEEQKQQKKGPNWRDRLAKRESEDKPEPKGSLALRDKFEQKAATTGGEEEGEKLSSSRKIGGGEKLAAARGKFEKQKAVTEMDGKVPKEGPKATKKGAAVANDGGGENAVKKQPPKKKSVEKQDGELKSSGEKSTVKKRVSKKKSEEEGGGGNAAAEEKKKSPTRMAKTPTTTVPADEKKLTPEVKPKSTTTAATTGPAAAAASARYTPSWRERMNK